MRGDDEPAPREREEERHLRAQRLGLAHELAARAPSQVAERNGRALRAREAVERATPGGAHERPAAHLQDCRELNEPAAVDEVVQPPAPDAVARILTELDEPVPERRHAIGGRMSEDRIPVLHVVVERAVHERDLPQRCRRQRDPVVVKMRELPGRERKRVVEQLAGKEGGRSGDRVGDEQREQAVVVGLAPAPVGLSDQLAVRGDEPGVAVDELRVPDRR